MAMAANEKLNFWIGLSDRKTDNLFLWADNSPVIFTNWDRRQPPHANSKLVSRNHWAVSWFRYDEEEGFFNGPGGSTMVPESFL